MNIQQINQVQTQIEAFNGLNLNTLIAEQYPNQDLRNINIGEISATNYVSTCNRVIRQLQVELDNENGIYLPYQYNFQNEFGNGNIINDISQLIANISGRNHPASIQFLNRLVYYQINNGFWDKSKTKNHSLRGLQITTLEERLNLLAEQLDQNLSAYNDFKNNAETNVNELSNFKIQKEKELSQITTNLNTSNEETKQISQLLNTSISTNEKIISILENAQEKLESLKEYYVKTELNFQDSQKMVSKLVSEIEGNIKKFELKETKIENYLEEVEGKKGFFDERIKYLNELIGREVGASLFETFKQRKRELKPSVEFWKKAVPTMTLITIIGIYAIFSNFFGFVPDGADTANDGWRLFALRSLKSLPLFVMLYFTIHQYGKERHFKEEYAFKSAVALTIKAYADLIEDQKCKDEMILNSVCGVYKSPILTKSKKKTLPTKDVTEIIKTITDATSKVVDKIKA